MHLFNKYFLSIYMYYVETLKRYLVHHCKYCNVVLQSIR